MIKVNEEKCIGCGACVKDCVARDIELINKKAVAKKVSCINCGHCVAVCPTKAVAIEDYDMDEVVEFKQDSFEINSENMLNFIKFRRSARHFKKQPIKEEVLKNIIEAGRYTATGSNRQNVSYVVVQQEIGKFRELALEYLSEVTQVAFSQNPSDPTMGYYAQKWKKQYEAELEESGKDDALLYNAPALILVVSDSPIDAALAASNMELQAATQGVGSFYGGFFMRAAQGSAKIKEILGLSQNQEVMVCMALGYSEVTYLRTVPRKGAQINWR